LNLARTGLDERDRENGRTMFSAAGCVLCHQFNGEGGATGPDLTSVGQRFTVRDILDATLNPSRAISDQYQMTTLELTDSRTLSGRIVARDEQHIRIATDLMRPTKSMTVPNDQVRSVRPEPVSTMPSGLLNALNEDELLDLLAYLVAGTNRDGRP
jgi:putative heme-binding domain-containing protein